jgi:hypothetical protein
MIRKVGIARQCAGANAKLWWAVPTLPFNELQC